MGRTTAFEVLHRESAYSAMFRCIQCDANEVKFLKVEGQLIAAKTANDTKWAKYEEQLNAAKEAIGASDREIEILRLTLRDALESHQPTESSTVPCNLASQLYKGQYKLVCEEAEIERRVAEGGVTESDKAICQLGHELVSGDLDKSEIYSRIHSTEILEG